jgi:hypothetical protein
LIERIADPSGSIANSSAARAWNSLLYSTSAGHAAKPFASKGAETTGQERAYTSPIW